MSLKKFSELGIKVESKKFVGEKVRLGKFLNVEIMVHDYKIEDSKYPKKNGDKCLHLQISVEGKKYVSFSIAKGLMQTIELIPKKEFPFSTKITNENDVYEFT